MSATPNDQSGDPSISQLLERAVNDMQGLFRAELRLARAEMTEDAKKVGVSGGLLAAGALLGIFAFSLFLEAIVELLEEIMPDWLAALLLGAVLGAVGGALAMAGRQRLKQTDLVPRETLASLREDTEIA